MTSIRTIGAVVRCLLFAGFVGCGGETGPARYAVSGTVKLDGQPLKNGRVSFVPVVEPGSPGPSAFGDVKAGEYQIPQEGGAIEGQHSVYIMVLGEPESTADDEEPNYEEVGQVVRSASIKPDGENKFEFAFEESELKDDPDNKDDDE